MVENQLSQIHLGNNWSCFENEKSHFKWDFLENNNSIFYF